MSILLRDKCKKEHRNCAMKFIVQRIGSVKCIEGNRKGLPSKYCRKQAFGRKIWIWFLELGSERRNESHTSLVDELPLSWVKYGSWTCSSNSTASYIWCKEKWQMISHKQKKNPTQPTKKAFILQENRNDCYMSLQ